MNRLYVVESTPTRHRRDGRSPPAAARRARSRRSRARVAARLGVAVPRAGAASTAHARWIAARRRATCRRTAGAASSIAGEQQPPAVHALAHAINAGARQRRHDGRLHRRRSRRSPVDQLAVAARRWSPTCDAGHGRAAGDPRRQPGLRRAGRPRLRRARSRRSPLRVHLGLYDDETARALPLARAGGALLETWSDARAFDGTVTIVQPLIAPLYGGAVGARAARGVRRRGPSASGYDLVRGHWKAAAAGGRLRAAAGGRRCTTASSPAPAAPPRAGRGDGRRLDRGAPAPPAERRTALEIVFRPDPTIYDGRFANNGWLQELPQAAHQAHLGQRGADRARRPRERLGVANERRRRARRCARPHACAAPVWIVPGQRRRRGHPAPRLRPHARRPRRRRRRLQRLRAAHRATRPGSAPGVEVAQDRRAPCTLAMHAGPPDAWKAATLVRAATARRVPRATRSSRSEMGEAPPRGR